MKPSSSTEVIAVLDLPPELTITVKALYDPELRDLVTPDLEQRFNTQAQFICANSLPIYGGSIWHPHSNFEVIADDEPFILAAANRVLQERNVLVKAAHSLAGRMQAARVIANFFGTDRKWRTWS